MNYKTNETSGQVGNVLSRLEKVKASGWRVPQRTLTKAQALPLIMNLITAQRSVRGDK